MKKQLHPTERNINTEGPSLNFSSTSTMKLFLIMLFALFSIISTKVRYEKNRVMEVVVIGKVRYEKYDVMEVKVRDSGFELQDSRIYFIQFLKREGKKADIKRDMSIKSCVRDCGPRRDCVEKCIGKYKCRGQSFNWDHYFYQCLE